MKIRPLFCIVICMLPDLNCPNCNAKQEFIPRYKLHKPGWQRRYIKCYKCKREVTLDYLTDAEVRRHRKINAIRLRKERK